MTTETTVKQEEAQNSAKEISIGKPIRKNANITIPIDECEEFEETILDLRIHDENISSCKLVKEYSRYPKSKAVFGVRYILYINDGYNGVLNNDGYNNKDMSPLEAVTEALEKMHRITERVSNAKKVLEKYPVVATSQAQA